MSIKGNKKLKENKKKLKLIKIAIKRTLIIITKMYVDLPSKVLFFVPS